LFRSITEEDELFCAQILNAFDSAVVGKTIDGTIRIWNREAEQVFGYGSQEIVGKSIMVLIPEERHEEEKRIMDRLKRGEKIGAFETIRKSKSGRLMNLCLSITPLKDKSGRVTGAFEEVREVHALKPDGQPRCPVEPESWKDDCLKSLGRMALGLAHELNQPLNAVLGYAEGSLIYLQDSANTTETVKSGLKLIVQETTRAGDIIKSLRSLARDRQSQGSIAINSVIYLTTRLLRHELDRSGSELNLILEDDLPMAIGNQVQITQVLINLILNGLQSMRSALAHGNTLTIASSKNGDCVEVEVVDQGTGITEETLKHLFNPCVTTKEGGMGLGLSISHAIIDRCGGELSYRPNPPGGAIMSFTLPVVENGE
jgi:PAS domain S-box-containing protein